MSQNTRLSVSTWSLHRALGVTYPDSPGEARQGRTETWGAGMTDLLEIPARVAQMGIHTLEICHFQIPHREGAWIGEMRGALQDAGVELFSVLVDAGDITHPLHHEREVEWAEGWIDVAAQLGAKRARMIAGKAENSPESMALSHNGLRRLADRGKEQGVRVTIENWFALLSRPEHVHQLLEGLEGDVGLNLDFGNWGGATKYDDLKAIYPRAESCHAKCHFDAPYLPDAEDYRHCLELSKEAGFAGPYTLVYDGPGEDEWEGLRREIEMVAPYLH